MLKGIIAVQSIKYSLFLKFGFPANKSVAEIIRERSDVDAVKCLLRFQKFKFKIWKKGTEWDLLQICHQDELTHKLFNLKLNILHY